MHASRPPDIRIIHKLSNLMDTLGEIMHNRYQIEYRLGNAPIILMGRLSLGPPERGAAEKNVSNKERMKGWGWGSATASVEEGIVLWSWWAGHSLD